MREKIDCSEYCKEHIYITIVNRENERPNECSKPGAFQYNNIHGIIVLTHAKYHRKVVHGEYEEIRVSELC
jgi:hypothetical protein